MSERLPLFVFLAISKHSIALIFVIVSQVYPAAGYAAEVQNNGGKVAIFNLDSDSAARSADFFFEGPCEQTLPECLGLVPMQ